MEIVTLHQLSSFAFKFAMYESKYVFIIGFPSMYDDYDIAIHYRDVPIDQSWTTLIMHPPMNGARGGKMISR